MESAGKRKKKVVRKKTSESQKVRVLLRPNQPLGTTFEYSDIVRALQVSEFVSDSGVKAGGVVPGMFLTEIDDLNVVGLKQGDVVFILQQKASSFREIVFSGIDPAVLHHAAENRRELRSQSASFGQSGGMSSPSSADDRHSLPQLHSSSNPKKGPNQPNLSTDSTPSPSGPTGGSTSNAYGNTRPSQANPNRTPVSSKCATTVTATRSNASSSSSSSRSSGGAYSTTKYISGSSVTASRSLRQSASGSSATTTAAAVVPSAASGGGVDPFSTPARRRRLVADIAKFLLKQYCVKACELVHTERLRNRSATVIQCAFRCCMARRLLFILLFARKTSAAVRMQLLYRSWVARAELQHRRKLRHIARTVTLAIRLQCRFRNRKAKRELQRLVKEREELLALMHKSSSIIQQQARMFLAKLCLQRKKKERDRIIRLKHRAAVRLECAYRKRMAARVVDQLRRALVTKNGMADRIRRAWRKYIGRKHASATLIQKSLRGVLGRRLARSRRLAVDAMAEELRLMRMEDDLSHILRDQDILAITVDINNRLLHELKECSAADLVKWCLLQSMLTYDSVKDEYGAGEVIRKAMEAANLRTYLDVDPALSVSSKPHGGGEGVFDEEKRIQIAAPSSSSLLSDNCPPEDRLPSLWGQRYIGRGGALGESGDTGKTQESNLEEQIAKLRAENKILSESFQDNLSEFPGAKGACNSGKGKALTVSVDDSGMILLHIENPAVDRRNRGRRRRVDSLTNADIFITLQGVDVDGDGDELEDEVGNEMMNFKFKDVTVSISLTTMPEEEEPVVEVEEPEEGLVVEEPVVEEAVVEDDDGIIEDDDDGGSGSDEEEKNDLEAVSWPPSRPTTAAASRPSTATARLKVSIYDEEAAARALAAAEEERRRREEAERAAAALRARNAKLAELTRRAMVERIQRAYRDHARHLNLVAATTLVQRCVRRSGIMTRWQMAVREVYRRAVFAVTQLQKQVRMMIAKANLVEMRFEYCISGISDDIRLELNRSILGDYAWAAGGSGVDGIDLDGSGCVFEDCVKKISERFTAKFQLDEEEKELRGDTGRACTPNEKSAGKKESCDLWYTSVENTTTGAQGNGPWAANILHILEYPRAPKGCIQPHEIILHIPSSNDGDCNDDDDLFDDSFDSAYGSWQKMADPSLLFFEEDDDIKPEESLGDVRYMNRRVNLERYKTTASEMPAAYRTVAANFTGFDDDVIRGCSDESRN